MVDVRDKLISTVTARYKTRGVVAEDVLVRNVIAALQGIQGTYISLTPDQRFVINTSHTSITESTHALISRILTTATAYYTIDKLVVDARADLLSQALIVAAHNATQHYLTDLAGMYSRCVSKNNNSSQMSLLRVEMRLRSWHHRLIELVELVESSRNLRETALLSHVHARYRRVAGNSICRPMVGTILDALLAVFHNALVVWLTEGRLDAIDHRWMIVSDESVPDECMWINRFEIDMSAVPSVLQNDCDLINKILVIGKSMAFLRSVYRLRANMINIDDYRSQLYRLPMSVYYKCDEFEHLHRVINTLYAHIGDQLLLVMNAEFQLKDHLMSLKDFLLLCNGAFFRSLYDQLCTDVSSNELPNASAMNRALSVAIDSTKAPYAQLAATCLDSPSWKDTDTVDHHAFTLTYRTHGPIMAMLSESQMSQYEQLFQFLWPIYCLEYRLTEVWKLHQVESNRFVARAPNAARLFRAFGLLSMELIMLMRKFHFYALNDVIGSAWHTFEATLAQQPGMEVTGFDHVIDAHSTYLKHIRHGLFLDDDLKDVYAAFSAAKENVSTFINLYKELYAICTDDDQHRCSGREIYVVPPADRAADSEEMRQRNEHMIVELLTRIKPELKVLIERHQLSMRDLLQALKEPRESTMLVNLARELDFAHFYERLFPQLLVTPRYSNRTNYYMAAGRIL